VKGGVGGSRDEVVGILVLYAAMIVVEDGVTEVSGISNGRHFAVFGLFRLNW